MPPRLARLATAIALTAVLVLPSVAMAGEPPTSTPPGSVMMWQQHLDHMRAIGPNLGAHVRDCVAMHGSMAGMMGPNGMMAEGMAEGMAAMMAESRP